jgi:peptidoglycan/xylan/chitin deacetylase (PgdA/CDA1 family)
MNRVQLAKILSENHAVNALFSLRRRAPFPWLTVLTYHRVAEREVDGGDYDEVIDALPQQFEWQIAFLKERFQFIGIEEMNRWREGKPLPDNPILLTFDDGYLECHSIVLPILKRHGARAAFFVATSYVEQRRMFWWDFINVVLRRTHEARIAIRYPCACTLELDRGHGPAAARLLQLVKSWIGLDLERFRAHLAEVAKVQWSDAEERRLVDQILMRWEHVVDLERAGMDVQSHTRTHRVLQTLSVSQLGDELHGSRRDLEEHLEKRVDAIAYPVGYSLAHLDHVRDALRAAGYSWGFTNQTGINFSSPPFDRFDIARMAMATEFDAVMFSALLACPFLAPRRSGRPLGADVRRR